MAVLAACDGETSSSGGDPAVAESARVDAPEELVGYDLRRLRPRDQPLAAMFDEKAGKARAEDKRVVVLFSADWCAPCRRLDTELGNQHPRAAIGDVRIFELKEEEWQTATRMDEFNRLRARWHPTLNSYPVMVVLDESGMLVEEMKQGKARLEGDGLDPTVPIWLESTRGMAGTSRPTAG
jgi:thiol-disulfide isomerase/thioredoxin